MTAEEPTCPACAAPIAIGDTFCEACGAPLSGAPSPDAQLADAHVQDVPVAGAAVVDTTAPIPRTVKSSAVCAQCGGRILDDGFCGTCGQKADLSGVAEAGQIGAGGTLPAISR